MAIKVKKHAQGFTLIEVIISLLIFALVLVLISSILMGSIGVHKKALDTTKNTMIGSSNLAKKEIGVSVTTNSVDQIVILDFTGSGGAQIEVKGNYYKDASDQTKFQYFDPRSYGP